MKCESVKWKERNIEIDAGNFEMEYADRYSIVRLKFHRNFPREPVELTFL